MWQLCGICVANVWQMCGKCVASEAMQEMQGKPRFGSLGGNIAKHMYRLAAHAQ